MSKNSKPTLPASNEKVGRRVPLIELPISYYKGIGRVIQAHAILEYNVSELIFTLMKVKSPEGRVAFGYRAASTMFTLARKLLTLRGITPNVHDVNLEKQIEDLCLARDQLAHCLWMERNGVIGMRLTQGNYKTPEGKRDRAIHPEGNSLPDGYFQKTRVTMLETAAVVLALTKHVKRALRRQRGKSRAR